MTQIQRTQRWQRRKDFRPSELLDAALAEFYEKGFDAARLEDIATRAGVSKGTIYLYFHSKEDVFEALVKGVPRANVEALELLSRDTEIASDVQLERFLTLVGTFIRDPRMAKFPRLIIAAAGRFPHLADIYRRDVISVATGLLASVIARGIARGVFKNVDPQQAAFAAVSPLLFVAVWQTTFERPSDTPFDADHFVKQHIETFLSGIRRRGEP